MAIATRAQGELHAAAVQGAFQPLPRKLKVPSQSWARFWRSKWGWSMLTRGSNEQEWLGYNHPDMKLSREAFQEMIGSGVHPGLILNFDQLWRACWATSKYKLAYKARSNAGVRTSKKKTRSKVRQESACSQRLEALNDSSLFTNDAKLT